MKFVLGVLPLLLLLLSFITNRFGGKRELLKIDLIQFIYAFVVTPAIIIWIKTVVFYNLKNELGIALNVEDTFLIDTVLTVISLYIFAFMVMHSITKSFKIKHARDPLFDILTHSEYFHLWLSHIATYSGWLLIMLFLGILNLFYPVIIFSNKSGLYLSASAGVALGLMFYHAMNIYKVEEQKKFNRVMKFQVYIYTLVILTSYFISKPSYTLSFSTFWCSVFFFVTAAISTQFLKSKHKKMIG